MYGWCWGASREQVRAGELEKTATEQIKTTGKTTAPQRDTEGAVGTGQGKKRGTPVCGSFSQQCDGTIYFLLNFPFN